MRLKLLRGILVMVSTLPALAQTPKPHALTPMSTHSAIKPRQHGPMKLVGIPRPGSVTSGNWSGYAVLGTGFSSAHGSWIVPKVKCGTTPNTWSSYWVGIDGFSDNTVEQLGTDSDCSGTTPQYYAWFEFFPNPSHLIASMAVHPGDVMSATVSHSGTQFTLKMTNHTISKTVSITKTFSAGRTSAEFIAEAPSNGVSVLPLADFTSVSLGNDYTSINDTNWATDTAVTGPISDFGAAIQKITMLADDGVTKKAVPSALTTDGSSFKVAWKHE